MPLELVVNQREKTIQSKSLMRALLGEGLAYSVFDKYRNFFVGKDVDWTWKQDDVTLSECLQDLLNDKALSCYAKSRPEKADDEQYRRTATGDALFYPTAKNYITRYKWSIVKMTEGQLMWAQHGE